jgi:hypothetical protein
LEDKNRDVKDLLEGNMYWNKLEITVNNNTMGGDPIYGKPKELCLVLCYKNEAQAVAVAEGKRLRVSIVDDRPEIIVY